MLTVRQITNKNPELLSQNEALFILGISLRTLQRRQKDTPNFPKSFYIKGNRTMKFFNRKQVEKWKEDHTPKNEKSGESEVSTS